jgi:hypothetical protein
LLKPKEASPTNTAGRQTQQPTHPVMQEQQQLPPKPIEQPSPMQLEERARLVAEIKRHHPKATTEQIVKDLEAWGE